jgi:hypothetical protein
MTNIVSTFCACVDSLRKGQNVKNHFAKNTEKTLCKNYSEKFFYLDHAGEFFYLNLTWLNLTPSTTPQSILSSLTLPRPLSLWGS